jgi:hypothetical protein
LCVCVYILFFSLLEKGGNAVFFSQIGCELNKWNHPCRLKKKWNCL